MRTSSLLRAFIGDEDGATMIEYVLFAAIAAIVLLVGFTLLGQAMTGMYTLVHDEISNATT
jgi:Flp pilus assembly pilin Flp